VDCDWSDAELATITCDYGTAENILHCAGDVPNKTKASIQQLDEIPLKVSSAP
jgi:hypothetical protein